MQTVLECPGQVAGSRGKPQAEDFVKVGSGICADEENSLAAVSECRAGGTGDGSFADAAFAGEKENARQIEQIFLGSSQRLSQHSELRATRDLAPLRPASIPII